ncbi:MAG: hypothetical protein MOGMAGMI_00800 [Candidatus Omnitrophica bacterium]|nr:hypothetical protein [Candidatus Omnitrophota bacterium]
MKKIVWVELILLFASILIFRSVWIFLDTFAWASSGVGLAILLMVGLVASVCALREINRGS